MPDRYSIAVLIKKHDAHWGYETVLDETATAQTPEAVAAWLHGLAEEIASGEQPLEPAP
jgi:hypothetical protein